jgi:hypothetical protein
MIQRLTSGQYEAIDAWTAQRGVEIDTPVIRKVKSGRVRVYCDFESRVPGLTCKFRHEMTVNVDGSLFHQCCKVLEGRI